eukprot:scaffold485452_cov39-Prasinocladus_malaysianus.AAC.1
MSPVKFLPIRTDIAKSYGGTNVPMPNYLQAANHVPRNYDVCIANVLEDHMQQLRARLLTYAKPGGQVVLSGMLLAQ